MTYRSVSLETSYRTPRLSTRAAPPRTRAFARTPPRSLLAPHPTPQFAPHPTPQCTRSQQTPFFSA
eukprot:835173-Prymnesium_polylepis.1